jgi:hypothetical protein
MNSAFFIKSSMLSSQQRANLCNFEYNKIPIVKITKSQFNKIIPHSKYPDLYVDCNSNQIIKGEIMNIDSTFYINDEVVTKDTMTTKFWSDIYLYKFLENMFEQTLIINFIENNSLLNKIVYQFLEKTHTNDKINSKFKMETLSYQVSPFIYPILFYYNNYQHLLTSNIVCNLHYNNFKNILKHIQLSKSDLNNITHQNSEFLFLYFKPDVITECVIDDKSFPLFYPHGWVGYNNGKDSWTSDDSIFKNLDKNIDISTYDFNIDGINDITINGNKNVLIHIDTFSDKNSFETNINMKKGIYMSIIKIHENNKNLYTFLITDSTIKSDLPTNISGDGSTSISHKLEQFFNVIKGQPYEPVLKDLFGVID